jgi:hypothetical protein
MMAIPKGMRIRCLRMFQKEEKEMKVEKEESAVMTLRCSHLFCVK